MCESFAVAPVNQHERHPCAVLSLSVAKRMHSIGRQQGRVGTHVFKLMDASHGLLRQGW